MPDNQSSDVPGHDGALESLTTNRSNNFGRDKNGSLRRLTHDGKVIGPAVTDPDPNFANPDAEEAE